MDLNPLHLLHHPSHANNLHLKVYEKNGKFGVGTEESNVPQFSFDTKAEADDYIRLAKDYQKENVAGAVEQSTEASSGDQAAPKA